MNEPTSGNGRPHTVVRCADGETEKLNDLANRWTGVASTYSVVHELLDDSSPLALKGAARR